MNSIESMNRPAIGPANLAGEMERLRQVAEVRRLWEEGEPADAQSFLEKNPHLASDRKLVFHLAFEEYAFRKQRGEVLAADVFSNRFPICKASLARMILATSFAAPFMEPQLEANWPEAGDSILDFEIIRELGRGSFARVYLAMEADLGNRPVVLKVSRRGGAEAQILGKLRHDNIVPIYSVKQDPFSELTAVCMPYLGETTLCDALDHVFRAGSQPGTAQAILDLAKVDAAQADLLGPEKPSDIWRHGSYVDGIIEIGIQLADALAFVHERKIYHRDLKPSNVLVRPDGRPMLLDFNLSFDEQADSRFVGGTPMYMSPEHLRAVDPDEKGPCLVDGRSDLFSLGVMLYELLTGREPFGALPDCTSLEETVRALRKRQEAGLAPARWSEAGVDGKLAGIVEKCLAIDARDRFQTAAELAAALRRRQAVAQSWPRRLARKPKTLLAVATLVLLLTSAIAAAFAFRQPYAERQYLEGVEALQAGDHSRAIGFLSRAIDDDDSIKARLARARAHQAQEDWQAAIADLRHVDKLEPGGTVKASLAYCHTKLAPPQRELAIGYYRDALRAGAKSPIIYNNLGYCLMESKGGSAEAAKWFKAATQLDPSFQLAHYHRALIDLQTSDARNVTREGLSAMAKVFEVGTGNARHHLDAARLYALAFFVEPRWQQLALDHIGKALQLGVPARQFERDGRFQALKSEPAFQRLLASAAAQVDNPMPVIQRNLDPSAGRAW